MLWIYLCSRELFGMGAVLVLLWKKVLHCQNDVKIWGRMERHYGEKLLNQNVMCKRNRDEIWVGKFRVGRDQGVENIVKLGHDSNRAGTLLKIVSLWLRMRVVWIGSGLLTSKLQRHYSLSYYKTMCWWIVQNTLEELQFGIFLSKGTRWVLKYIWCKLNGGFFL